MEDQIRGGGPERGRQRLIQRVGETHIHYALLNIVSHAHDNASAYETDTHTYIHPYMYTYALKITYMTRIHCRNRYEWGE